ncbi:unnamed protein product [Gordionus sp. m RMFG-2023]
MSLCARYFYSENDEVQIKEDFLQFIPIQDMRAISDCCSIPVIRSTMGTIGKVYDMFKYPTNVLKNILAKEEFGNNHHKLVKIYGTIEISKRFGEILDYHKKSIIMEHLSVIVSRLALELTNFKDKLNKEKIGNPTYYLFYCIQIEETTSFRYVNAIPDQLLVVVPEQKSF